ncbi:hypothetical protein BCR35DRAFT_61281 [Leucosporidium creatinivorum]|uniref:Uncharacterized protein n=1 Tax=Leucosporidium creatinivorum TaxID=106004 RepID=A0A1Y2FL79_9BASI|nr:hypothetical protein BCR35DRAFT_61281 [Leucosporidium creatinivorum]
MYGSAQHVSSSAAADFSLNSVADPKPSPNRPLIRPRGDLPLPNDSVNLSADPPTYYGLVHPGIGPRPDLNFNIFDTSTMTFAAPASPAPAHLLEERHFKRKELGGPEVAVYHNSSSKTRYYGTHRLTTLSSLNLDCNGPGEPWIWTGGANEHWMNGLGVSVFVQHKKPTRDARDGWIPDGEGWRAYGMYEVAWAGRPLPGSFNEPVLLGRRRSSPSLRNTGGRQNIIP